MNRSVIATAVVGLVVLAGCDGTPEPSPPPTSEPALTTATVEPDDVEQTSEAAPSTEAPEETDADPTGEMEQTEEGAEAFVEHYMDSLNAAYTTGDVSAVREMSTAECQSCNELAADAETSPAGEEPFQVTVDKALLVADSARVQATIGEGADVTEAVFELVWSEDAWNVNAILISQR